MAEEKRAVTVGEPRRRLTAAQWAQRIQRQPDFTHLDPDQGYEWPVPHKTEEKQEKAGSQR